MLLGMLVGARHSVHPHGQSVEQPGTQGPGRCLSERAGEGCLPNPCMLELPGTALACPAIAPHALCGAHSLQAAQERLCEPRSTSRMGLKRSVLPQPHALAAAGKA